MSTFLTVIFFVAGFIVIGIGFKTYRTGQIIQNTATENVQSMAVGRTELQGKARDAGLLFDQPFGTGKCLYYKYSVKERRKETTTDKDGNKKTKKKWKTISSGSAAAPFYLDDDTGEVLVLANEGADFSISSANTSQRTFNRGQSPPSSFKQFDTTVEVPEQLRDNVDTSRGRIRTFIRKLRGKDEEPTNLKLSKPSLGNTSRRRRYKQEVLPPDEDVYVFGSAEIREDPIGESNEERLTMQKDEGTGRFIVSDKGEETLATKFRRRGALYTSVGILISTVALYLLLTNVVFA